MAEATCKNCMHKMSYAELVKRISLDYAREHNINRGQYVCPLKNHQLIIDMKDNCKAHVYKVK